ncbi:MAG: lysophospholipid acyltransferase family protein [Alphaproteobacteria bacterium]
MIYIRSFLFSAFSNTLTYLFGMLIIPILFIPSKRMHIFVSKSWVEVILFALRFFTGLTYKIEGKIPTESVIFASKHQSTMETFVFYKILNNPVVVLRKTLVYIPVFGWYLARVGMIPIDRKLGRASIQKIDKTARKRKKENRHFLIFPQGTRVPFGEKKPYLPGVAVLYKALDLPIVPVALNTGRIWRKGQFLKKPGVATFRFLDPIEAGLGKKELMQRLKTAIETEMESL